MWALAGCALQGSPELVVSGPEGATLPGEGTWLHTELLVEGSRSTDDLLFVDPVPHELRCGSVLDEPMDVLPGELSDLWQQARDTFDAGDADGACALRRDYFGALADWGGPWGAAGLVSLVAGADEDLRLEASQGWALLDLVGTIDHALAELDCADRPGREAPTPYTLGTERAHFVGRSGGITADARWGRLVVEFDRYTLVADTEDDLDDLVLDGAAVLERCEREVDLPAGDRTVSGVE
jgi:hypothetical protein